MSELKPCPACKSRQEDDHIWLTGNGKGPVYCSICGMYGPNTVYDKAAAWNALPRIVQAAPSDREKRLEDALRKIADGGVVGGGAAKIDGGWRGYVVFIQDFARAALAAAPDHISQPGKKVDTDNLHGSDN